MSGDEPRSGRWPEQPVTTVYPNLGARVSQDYPFHEVFRGALVTVKKFHDDGSVVTIVEDGPEQGSVLILDPKYLVRFS